jgi:RNA polymerase sigma-70 factor (ECF subfamily)
MTGLAAPLRPGLPTLFKDTAMHLSLALPPRGPSVPRNDGHVTDLALAAAHGDPDAFEQFVHATHADVWRFVAHLCSDVHSAEDLTQETYLRVITGLPRFAGQSSARTWLLSIARRVVIDRYRTASVRPRIAEGPEDWQVTAERSQPSTVPGFDEGIALFELISMLEPQRRRAFVLTQIQGLPYAEAAAAVGCPIGTVRSRVARAREDMRTLLEAAEAPVPTTEQQLLTMKTAS